jgi:hypothetical protein
MHGNHPQGGHSPTGTLPTYTAHTHQNRDAPSTPRVDWTTWWLWRGARTRSHPELGRENPQRPWYCVLRHGRVGRRQVFQSTLNRPATRRANPRGTPVNQTLSGTHPQSRYTHQRGVEQPGSSSGCPAPIEWSVQNVSAARQLAADVTRLGLDYRAAWPPPRRKRPASDV